MQRCAVLGAEALGAAHGGGESLAMDVGGDAAAGVSGLGEAEVRAGGDESLTVDGGRKAAAGVMGRAGWDAWGWVEL